MARQRRRPTSKMAPAKSSRGAPAKLQQRRDDTEVKKHAEFMARQVKIAVKRYPSLFQQHYSNLQTGIAALFHCAERTSRQRGERRAQDKLDSIIPPPKNSRSQRCLEVIVNGRLAATAWHVSKRNSYILVFLPAGKLLWREVSYQVCPGSWTFSWLHSDESNEIVLCTMTGSVPGHLDKCIHSYGWYQESWWGTEGVRYI